MSKRQMLSVLYGVIGFVILALHTHWWIWVPAVLIWDSVLNGPRLSNTGYRR
jgi:hypothetical protein